MWYAMSGIWTEDGGGWTLSLPVGFPDEATLHDLIEQTPEMLPLSGAPFLVILSREVPLGSGYADLVGVETSGRPVIVEIKLEQNRDARRAVVAQILAYAAYLHGTTREQLEDLVGSSLRRRGYESVVDAMASVQEDALDGDEFTEALDEHLREGRFRLVFVLDAAPQELMTLVAYLEHVTEKLVIDLVAVSSFNVGSASVMLPQRVTPERHEVTIKKTRRREPAATYHKGSEKFEASITEAPMEHQKDLYRLLRWAQELENRGLATLSSSQGKGLKRFVLNPRLQSEGAALVTIWNEGGASLQFWRSVLERSAPGHLERIEGLAPVRIGQGNSTREFSDELLEALTAAYEDAAS